MHFYLSRKNRNLLLQVLSVSFLLIVFLGRFESKYIFDFVLVAVIYSAPGLLFVLSLDGQKFNILYLGALILVTGILINSTACYFLTMINAPNIKFTLIVINCCAYALSALKIKKIKKRIDLSSPGIPEIIILISLALVLNHLVSYTGGLFMPGNEDKQIPYYYFEYHSLVLPIFSIDSSHFPFYTMLGWPYINEIIPFKILHLPLPFFAVKTVSFFTSNDLVFAHYLTSVLMFSSLGLLLSYLARMMLNRYTSALIAATYFLLFFILDYASYYRVLDLLSLTTLSIFMILSISLDKTCKAKESSIIYIFLLTLTLGITQNQFILCVFPAMAIYYIYSMAMHRNIKWLFYSISSLFATLIAAANILNTHLAAYPTHTKYFPSQNDVTSILIMPFYNIIYGARSWADLWIYILIELFSFGFGLSILFFIWILGFKLGPKNNKYSGQHVLLLSLIFISLTIFFTLFQPAGYGTRSFLLYASIPMFFYGSSVLSFKRIVPCAFSLILIAYYIWFSIDGNIMMKHHGKDERLPIEFYILEKHGSLNKRQYRFFQKINQLIPRASKLLVISDYKPSARGYYRDSESLSCQFMTNHFCIYNSIDAVDIHKIDLNDLQRQLSKFKINYILAPSIFEDKLGRIIDLKVVNKFMFNDTMYSLFKLTSFSFYSVRS